MDKFKERICRYCKGTNTKKGDQLFRTKGNSIICNTCMSLYEANYLFEFKDTEVIKKEAMPKPMEIKAELDKYVIGQEKAKQVLSVALVNHLKKAKICVQEKVNLDKSNVLLLGPTGCGKTFLIKHLAKIAGVPLVQADATSLTSAGYVGRDVEDVISDLYKAANCNKDITEIGIVYIDEIDKIKSIEGSGLDVGGTCVQQGLLKIIEGCEVEVEVGRGMAKRKETIDTKNILFIFSGSFAGIEKNIDERLSKKSSIGFEAKRLRGEKSQDLNKDIILDDLVNFGMIPEFIGRIPLVVALKELTTKQLVSVLKDTKNNLMDHYRRLFKEDNININFDDKALEKIAQVSKERGTGARGLRAIFENSLLPMMFKAPSTNRRNITLKEKDIRND